MKKSFTHQSYDQDERLLPTFINTFLLFMKKSFINVFIYFFNFYYNYEVNNW